MSQQSLSVSLEKEWLGPNERGGLKLLDAMKKMLSIEKDLAIGVETKSSPPNNSIVTCFEFAIAEVRATIGSVAGCGMLVKN